MKLLGNILIWLGLYAVYAGSLGSQQYSFGSFLLHVAFGAPFFLIGSWLVSMSNGGVQVDLDRLAQAIADAQASEHVVFLYLRPFDSTNVYRIRDTSLTLFSAELWERDGFDDIERLLSRALERTGIFLALGKPGEHRGAGRAELADEHWQAKVAGLLVRSSVLILLPARTPGTLWEIARIVDDGHLDKTLFIMPPSDGSLYTMRGDEADHWARTQEACSKLGLDLPVYRPAGAIFKYLAGARQWAITDLPGPDPIAWADRLQFMLDIPDIPDSAASA
ncbi:hypothetical protein IP92_01615 [Pseudoduganella flava]|uniref:Uncharacterized protein n=1 Tax=Pseudoduganella flava TaxID=871742 RepID=A0A562Q227_9BURK|nr:hypothetical protein [Pseudoduganella flava]QGZ38100.1 hypothetical protein GO485_02910 [Pseudoduganella flava]TWI50386.1 hypothetical protein IP92_01615 [Pseudoduganella flava]